MLGLIFLLNKIYTGFEKFNQQLILPLEFAHLKYLSQLYGNMIKVIQSYGPVPNLTYFYVYFFKFPLADIGNIIAFSFFSLQ